MQPKRTLSSSADNTKHTIGSQATETTTPIWIRVGIPVGCALLAAILNFAAVKRQIQPVKAYAFRSHLPMGTRLQASHLTVIDLAGSFDRSGVILENDLLVQDSEQGRPLSLAVSLQRRPKIVSRAVSQGEVVVQSSLGGIEGPRENEMVMEVPRAMIRASDEFLTPGKEIYFRVQGKRRLQESAMVTMIGPFRIAIRDLPEDPRDAKSQRDKGVQLAYGLTKSNEPSAAALLLQEAIADPSSFALFPQEARVQAIEQSSPTSIDGTATSQPPQDSQIERG